MQTCTFFATYTGWLSRELERTDPDLLGTEKPAQMNQQQWDRFKETQAQRHADSTALSSAGGGPSEEARLEKMFEIIQGVATDNVGLIDPTQFAHDRRYMMLVMERA